MSKYTVFWMKSARQERFPCGQKRKNYHDFIRGSFTYILVRTRFKQSLFRVIRRNEQKILWILKHTSSSLLGENQFEILTAVE